MFGGRLRLWTQFASGFLMVPDRRIFLARNHFTGLRSALRADYHPGAT
jgi:hypothetical protein